MKARCCSTLKHLFICLFAIDVICLERMEIFDTSTSQDREQGIRRVTLRHPRHDVYLSWDHHLNVRACSGGNGGRNNLCLQPPYWYIEDGGSNASQCFKLRLLTSQNNSIQQVAYLHVTRRSWELKLRTQRSILTRAMVAAASRAWESTLQYVTNNQKRRKRAKRRHRCVIDLNSVRERVVNDITPRDVKQSMRKNKDCFHGNVSNTLALISRIPWKEMTSEMKSSLDCHVNAVVRYKLRKIVDSRCTKRRRTGEAHRRQLVDRVLAGAWDKWRSRGESFAHGNGARIVDNEISMLCAEGLT